MATMKDKRQYWQSVIDRYSGSGLSQKDFCRKEDISLHSFQYWNQRLRHHGVVAQGFSRVEVEVSPRLPDPAWVAQLILHLHGAR